MYEIGGYKFGFGTQKKENDLEERQEENGTGLEKVVPQNIEEGRLKDSTNGPKNEAIQVNAEKIVINSNKDVENPKPSAVMDLFCCTQQVQKPKNNQNFVKYEKVLVPQMNRVKIEVENMEQYLKMKITSEIEPSKIKQYLKTQKTINHYFLIFDQNGPQEKDILKFMLHCFKKMKNNQKTQELDVHVKVGQRNFVKVNDLNSSAIFNNSDVVSSPDSEAVEDYILGCLQKHKTYKQSIHLFKISDFSQESLNNSLYDFGQLKQFMTEWDVRANVDLIKVHHEEPLAHTQILENILGVSNCYDKASVYTFDLETYKHYLVKRINNCFGSVTNIDVWVEGTFYHLDIVKETIKTDLIKLESNVKFCPLLSNIDESQDYYDFAAIELSNVKFDDLDSQVEKIKYIMEEFICRPDYQTNLKTLIEIQIVQLLKKKMGDLEQLLVLKNQIDAITPSMGQFELLEIKHSLGKIWWKAPEIQEDHTESKQVEHLIVHDESETNAHKIKSIQNKATFGQLSSNSDITQQKSDCSSINEESKINDTMGDEDDDILDTCEEEFNLINTPFSNTFMSQDLKMIDKCFESLDEGNDLNQQSAAKIRPSNRSVRTLEKVTKDHQQLVNIDEVILRRYHDTLQQTLNDTHVLKLINMAKLEEHSQISYLERDMELQKRSIEAKLSRQHNFKKQYVRY